ncbi:MAG: DUF262 domain-containing protein [Gammaproteobacteria bacterium]|nr:DUF262 domain-containing protein [Gammaproteobacteria bacterium]MBU2005752.1 DUF262 domain-containing protein [Gammaproteobacteria bacterium]
MSNVKYKGKISSFWMLLKAHKIEIPIIQRDYAQGREDKQEIRENFLNALLQSIENNIAIKLDFIYGSVEDNASQPLDGQQRLTTLFLLHWYAAIKGKTLDDENAGILKKFTYETRISSREFCNTLVSKSLDLSESKRPSDQIIDSAWFFLSWKKDPTIDAMLRTIDDIHKYFFHVDNLWEKLISDNGLISFYHIELKDIGLTDDLYIKMNARGKLLSPFENFKASFQKRVNDEGWDKNKEFQDTFALKIDSAWTDLFWQLASNYRIDDAFTRFIATISMCRQSVRKTDNRLAIISKLQDNYNAVRPEHFNEDDFVYLCKSLDIYCRVYEEKWDIDIGFPLFQHTPGKSIFLGVTYEGDSAPYPQKVLFYAQTEYLLKVDKIDKSSFLDWMRVVRNIISRGDVVKNGSRPAIIRSPQTFDGVINLIHELSAGCSNIYEYLSSAQIKSLFAKEQIEEERLKARLITSSFNNKDIIFKTEDTNLLQGRISFALYCMNFEQEKNFDSLALEKVQSVITKYFNSESDISSDLRRALLTIADDNGNYNYYGYWLSFWNVVGASKRCLLDNSLRELEYYIYGNNSEDYRVYMKKLIIELMDNDLKAIALNFIPPPEMPNWKIRLIKEKRLLDHECKSNHIAIPNDEKCCYLLKSMRPRDLDGCIMIE